VTDTPIQTDYSDTYWIIYGDGFTGETIKHRYYPMHYALITDKSPRFGQSVVVTGKGWVEITLPYHTNKDSKLENLPSHVSKVYQKTIILKPSDENGKYTFEIIEN
jgi:hypothetical protein